VSDLFAVLVVFLEVVVILEVIIVFVVGHAAHILVARPARLIVATAALGCQERPQILWCLRHEGSFLRGP